MVLNNNPLCKMLGLELPIVQGGMIYVSGAKLAAAVSENGMLGLIGAGSMTPELLRQHIQKAHSLTKKPVGVNVPLLYSHAKDQIAVALDEGIKIFFTSGGSPKIFTAMLKSHGAIVVHVTSSPDLAKKCEDAGVDMVVAEGFEAGGHNGRDELTTLVLVNEAVRAVKIPVIAAGGIADGRSILAALALGAHGVQMGTRFAATVESSAHENFKQKMLQASYTSTTLHLKKLSPVRLLENEFSLEVNKLEQAGASKEELAQLLGHGRSRKGMLEGNLQEGELEIGQIVGMIKDLPTVAQLKIRLVQEIRLALSDLKSNVASFMP